MSQAGQFLIWQVLFLVELRFPLDFPAGLLGDNQASIAAAYSPSSTRSYARHIDLRAKFVARVLKKRDFILGYIRTHTNIADQFTKIVDQISHRRFRDWMAGGLDGGVWAEGEVVETLENVFQMSKMREMIERKEVQREQLKADCKKKPRATQLATKANKKRKVTTSD
jgi:hypothetical protein